MSITNRIEVVRKADGKQGVLTAANTAIYLNGQRLDNVKSFNLKIEAAGIAVVTLEMYVRDVKLDGVTADINKIEVPLAHVIGQFGPKLITEPPEVSARYCKCPSGCKSPDCDK